MNRQFGEFAWRKVTILSAFSKESFKKKVDEKCFKKRFRKCWPVTTTRFGMLSLRLCNDIMTPPIFWESVFRERERERKTSIYTENTYSLGRDHFTAGLQVKKTGTDQKWNMLLFVCSAGVQCILVKPETRHWSYKYFTA